MNSFPPPQSMRSHSQKHKPLQISIMSVRQPVNCIPSSLTNTHLNVCSYSSFFSKTFLASPCSPLSLFLTPSFSLGILIKLGCSLMLSPWQQSPWRSWVCTHTHPHSQRHNETQSTVQTDREMHMHAGVCCLPSLRKTTSVWPLVQTTAHNEFWVGNICVYTLEIEGKKTMPCDIQKMMNSEVSISTGGLKKLIQAHHDADQSVLTHQPSCPLAATLDLLLDLYCFTK